MAKIGIIGCGNMGEAILSGIVSNRVASRKEIRVSDVDSTKLNRIKKNYGVEATFNNSLVAEASDIIVIAVKPQDIEAVLSNISEVLNNKKLIISVAAGVRIKKIVSIIGCDVPVVRIMPNMPALINKGFCAVSFSKDVPKNMVKYTMDIFGSIGDAVEVNEKDLDVITAISGSGPAYFFYLIELLIKNGIRLGLRDEIARKAAIKTAVGSIELLIKQGEDPSSLRAKVTSKGGTTEAAFRVFKKDGLEKIIQKGIKAARDKSKELSGGN